MQQAWLVYAGVSATATLAVFILIKKYVPHFVIDINSLLDLVFSLDFCESNKCIKSNLSS